MKTLMDKSKPGLSTDYVGDIKGDVGIPQEYLREGLDLPELSESDVMRHYTSLSNRNWGIDNGFYPLGSCTMKYNPRVNEDMARLLGFSGSHPLLPDSRCQGNLELMYELESMLSEITGMDSFTLTPAAGAHGELVGIMLIKAYFKDINEKRTKILVPDSAHGTNPATAGYCGYDVVVLASDERGNLDLDDLHVKMGKDVAGLMLTNPNTLGLFDENIAEITKIVHDSGGLVYYDGANMNAIMGRVRPGDMGYDIVHLNLHKTFSTPHGGGGPGSGPVGVKKRLAKYLPNPRIEKTNDGFILRDKTEPSIGRVCAFQGSFGVIIRAYTYIKALGGEGLKKVSDIAVLNANYLKKMIQEDYEVPFDRACMHEFVASGTKQKYQNGVKTLDIAKRILDYGVHAPTIYFPLIVEEALMIEPTETEAKEELDRFAEIMKDIAKECRENPELVKGAPYTTRVKRLDDALAARKPVLQWRHKRD